MSLESIVYELVAELENPNCARNCVRPPNVLRSLTGAEGIWPHSLEERFQV